MLGWALIINNVGRRCYPLYWWAPGPTFVMNPVEEPKGSLRKAEEGETEREQTDEGNLAEESDEPGSRLDQIVSDSAPNPPASE